MKEKEERKEGNLICCLFYSCTRIRCLTYWVVDGGGDSRDVIHCDIAVSLLYPGSLSCQLMTRDGYNWNERNKWSGLNSSGNNWRSTPVYIFHVCVFQEDDAEIGYRQEDRSGELYNLVSHMERDSCGSCSTLFVSQSDTIVVGRLWEFHTILQYVDPLCCWPIA